MQHPELQYMYYTLGWGRGREGGGGGLEHNFQAHITLVFMGVIMVMPLLAHENVSQASRHNREIQAPIILAKDTIVKYE